MQVAKQPAATVKPTKVKANFIYADRGASHITPVPALQPPVSDTIAEAALASNPTFKTSKPRKPKAKPSDAAVSKDEVAASASEKKPKTKKKKLTGPAEVDAPSTSA